MKGRNLDNILNETDSQYLEPPPTHNPPPPPPTPRTNSSTSNVSNVLGKRKSSSGTVPTATKEGTSKGMGKDKKKKYNSLPPSDSEEDDDDNTSLGKALDEMEPVTNFVPDSDKATRRRITAMELSAAKELLATFRTYQREDSQIIDPEDQELCQKLDKSLRRKPADMSEETYLSREVLRLIRLKIFGREKSNAAINVDSEEEEEGTRKGEKRKEEKERKCKKKRKTLSMSNIRENPETSKAKKDAMMKPDVDQLTDPMIGGDSIIVYGAKKSWAGSSSKQIVLQRRYIKDGEDKFYEFSFHLNAVKEMLTAIKTIGKEMEELEDDEDDDEC